MLYLMVLSSVFLTPLCSSVNSGSTRVWSLMSFCRALAAHMRTARVGSFSALMKVVCSWGRNGFNMAPTWKMKHVYHTGHKRCTLPQLIKKEVSTIYQRKCFFTPKYLYSLRVCTVVNHLADSLQTYTLLLCNIKPTLLGSWLNSDHALEP